MSTMEKLFLQIFERKKWIVDQVKHQTDLFDQHLASKCLLDGIAPPPWLWNPSFHSTSSHADELKKEELISGLLLPRPQPAVPYSSSYCSLYHQPFLTAQNTTFPANVCVGLNASGKQFNAGSKESVLPECSMNAAACESNSNSEQDPSVTSPQDCRDIRTSDIYLDPGPSLAKFQRSRSRQRALELRNSAKGDKKRPHYMNDLGASASHITVAGVSSLQSNHTCESELAGPADMNNESCTAEETKLADLQRSIITQSRSSIQQENSLNELPSIGRVCSIAKEDGQTCRESIGKATQQHDYVCESLGLVNVMPDESNVATEAKVGDDHSKEQGSNAYFGRITRSRSSSQQHSCVNKLKSQIELPNHVNELIFFVKPFNITGEQYGLNANAGYCQSKENLSDQCTGTRLKTDCSNDRELNHVNSSNTVGHGATSSKSIVSGKSPLRKSLNRFQGIGLQDLSGTQLNALPCSHSSDIVHQEKRDPVVTETAIDPNVVAELHSVSSGSNSGDSNLGVDLEVLVSKLPSECTMVVNPKQLDFADVKVHNLNKTDSPALEDKTGNSSDWRSSTLLHSGAMQDKAFQVDGLERCRLPLEMPLMRGQQVLSKEEKGCRVSSEAYDETALRSTVSNANALAPSKETSEVYRDLVTDTNQESHEISGKNSTMCLHSNSLELIPENFIGDPLEGAVRSTLLTENLNSRIYFTCENGTEDLGPVKPRKSAPEVSKDVEKSVDEDFAIATESTPGDQDVNIRYSENVVSVDGNGYSSQNADSCIQGAWITDYNNEICSKMIEGITTNCKQSEESDDSEINDSSPQYKRRKVEGQFLNVLSASPTLMEDVMQAQVTNNPVEETDAIAEHYVRENSECPSKLQDKEDTPSFAEIDNCVNASLILTHEQLGASSIPSLNEQATGNSPGCSSGAVAFGDPTSFTFHVRRQLSIADGRVMFHLEDKFEMVTTDHQTCAEETLQGRRSHLEWNDKFPYGSVGSLLEPSMDMVNADETMPVFEGFIMQADDGQSCTAEDKMNFDQWDLPKTTVERASALEQLCKSACMLTPLSHFSNAYKSQKTPNFYHSVPNGLLESMDVRSTLPRNKNASEELSVEYSSLNAKFEHVLPGKSYSDCLTYPSDQSRGKTRKPYESPVRKLWDRKLYESPVPKLWDRITSNSGSSVKQSSLNPDLPCISEENENADEVDDAFQECISSKITTSSIKREPLAEIKDNQNLLPSASEAEICTVRDSLDSTNTEFSFGGTYNRAKQKLGNHGSIKRTQKKKVKENHSVRARQSVRNRVSKPKLSTEKSLRTGGPSFLEQGSKPNNIVSNITSFIPLVQQKQAAGVIAGKRDVKVKALEAAEAAKRLAEKKENERKMKKEALKHERARLERENLKQLELQKKKKEVERQKKEAEIGAKKRQREEEERKEKERKRKCLEEAQRQRRDREEKLRAKKDAKEMKTRPTVERIQEGKERVEETAKPKKIEIEMGNENLRTLSQTEPREMVLSTSEVGKPSTFIVECEASSHFVDDAEVINNLNKATENGNLATNTNQEESYDISPYKGSDDEDEEDDDMPNTKFIPSWASKNSVALAVSSQKSVEPEVIFPPQSFCSIAEVLLPRKHQLKIGGA